MSENVGFYAILSTVIVSLLSLAGAFLFLLKSSVLNRILIFLVCFSAGALLGNAFFHLIPESFCSIGLNQTTSWLILGGFLLFFIIDQALHTHSSAQTMKNNIQPYGYLSLYADAIHNFIDGVLIGATWMFMPELGVVTTISIVLHEIPQEISDLGILIHSGFTRAKALLFNFLSALTAVIGTVLALWIGHKVEHFSAYILPLAAGGFVYLAASSLLPEVIKDTTKRNLWLRLFFVLLGLFLIYYFSLESGGYTHRHSH